MTFNESFFNCKSPSSLTFYLPFFLPLFCSFCRRFLDVFFIYLIIFSIPLFMNISYQFYNRGRFPPCMSANIIWLLFTPSSIYSIIILFNSLSNHSPNLGWLPFFSVLVAPGRGRVFYFTFFFFNSNYILICYPQ